MRPRTRSNALERIGAQFGDDIPASIGRMQRRHRGIALQGLDDLVDVVAFDGKSRERRDTRLVLLRAHAHGVARNRAVALELAQPVLHRAAGATRNCFASVATGVRAFVRNRLSSCRSISSMVHRLVVLPSFA
jgi:hypothetical protein